MSNYKPPRIESMAELVQATVNDLAGWFDQMEWAEDEIAQASHRHPAEVDTLFHSFCLLTPTHTIMSTEFVYRAHCRELLERVAAGADTRPGTTAEICCACCEASQIAPLKSPAAGLYLRMWAVAFPEKSDFIESQQAHEALEGTTIDDLEATMRGKLAVRERTPRNVDCSGLHHGDTVQCRYHTTAEAA